LDGSTYLSAAGHKSRHLTIVGAAFYYRRSFLSATKSETKRIDARDR